MIEVHGLQGIGEVMDGDDLPALLAAAVAPAGVRVGDILVVTQKVVSKAEGRFVRLGDIAPGARARVLAGTTLKDPRLVELVLAESTEIVRATRNVLIARHRLGLVMANAGIDASNLGPGEDGRVLLLPLDPDASAARIADAVEAVCGTRPGVIVSDSFGRPWRHGVVQVAIGCDGIPALDDRRGQKDRDGRRLEVTQIGFADLVACAAGLALGEAAEGVPAALVRGARASGPAQPASALVRPLDEDLFR